MTDPSATASAVLSALQRQVGTDADRLSAAIAELADQLVPIELMPAAPLAQERATLRGKLLLIAAELRCQ